MNKTESLNMWNGFAASVPGAGHIRYGIPCQDASDVILNDHPAIIVCDGRGSAKLSHFGANDAISAFRRQLAIMSPYVANILDNSSSNKEKWDNFCKLIYRTLLQVKLDLAEKHACSEKEFDFTVALAVVGKEYVGCFQVGDGSLVVLKNGDTKTVFSPDKGEFANQTSFLRLGGDEKGQFKTQFYHANDITGICATSDGPEHLMFHLPEMKPGKIFDTLFADLKAGELSKQDLMDYLTRNAWNNDPRGADDRSIAIIALTQESVVSENDECEKQASSDTQELEECACDVQEKQELDVSVCPIDCCDADVGQSLPEDEDPCNCSEHKCSRKPKDIVLFLVILNLFLSIALLTTEIRKTLRCDMTNSTVMSQINEPEIPAEATEVAEATVAEEESKEYIEIPVEEKIDVDKAEPDSQMQDSDEAEEVLSE